jgi:4-hydroxy-tetrahydrodipicolinate synthase
MVSSRGKEGDFFMGTTFVPKGIIPAMVTPFTADDKINEQSLRQLTTYLIEGGVHGLFAVGSQGEFWALDADEKRQVFEIVIDETRGRVPVYAGTGAVTTREAIRLTQIAEEVGVDAVSVLTPFFLSLSQDELVDFYTEVAEATSLPVILYNNPGRTGINISVETVVRLARDVDNIIGIKDSSGDLQLSAEYIRCTGDDFYVLMGRDTLIYGGLLYGAAGSIAASANVKPSVLVEIYDAFMEGDLKRSLEAQRALAPLRIAFGLGTFPNVVKEAVNMIGIDVGRCRGPVGLLAPDKRKQLNDVLVGMGMKTNFRD